MGQQKLNKVPQVTIFFWIIQITATILGERATDFLINNLNFGLTNTTIIISVLLIIALYFQFKRKKYTPSIYWLAVILIGMVGTLGSDILDVSLQTKAIILFVLMAFSFFIWYLSERTLSIYSINTTKREVFYWFVLLLAYAFGKAAGDWSSEMLSLNYFSSFLMFVAVIGIVRVAYQDYKLNSILAFWLTYILTTPFGKSLSDFLTKPLHSGGLGLGTTGTSLIFVLTMVIYLTKMRKEDSGTEGIRSSLRQYKTR